MHTGDACIRVLKIRTGVPVQGQGLVPRKRNSRLWVLTQVRVLDGADPHGARHFAARSLRHLRAGCRHNIECTLLGFIQEVLQLDHVALARREGGIRQTHQPEPNVLQIGLVPQLAADREELLEVQLLPLISDIDNLVRLVLLDSRGHRRNIRRCIVEAAIALAHDADGKFLLFEEDNRGAFAFFRHALLFEQLNRARQLVIIEALAANHVECDIQAFVDVIELAEAEPDELLPQGRVLRITGLQLHKFLPTLRQPLLVFA